MMRSRSERWSASPAWVGAAAAAQLARRPVERPAVPGRARATPAPRLRLEGAARRSPDRAVAATLLTLWVVLWTVFLAGVVVPAAGLRGAGEAERGPRAAPQVVVVRAASVR